MRRPRFAPPESFLVLTSIRAWLNPSAVMRLEGLDTLKGNPVTSSECEPVTFRLWAYRLNKLRYPMPQKKYMKIDN
jgi:hypothetical protein